MGDAADFSGVGFSDFWDAVTAFFTNDETTPQAIEDAYLSAGGVPGAPNDPAVSGVGTMATQGISGIVDDFDQGWNEPTSGTSAWVYVAVGIVILFLIVALLHEVNTL